MRWLYTHPSSPIDTQNWKGSLEWLSAHAAENIKSRKGRTSQQPQHLLIRNTLLCSSHAKILSNLSRRSYQAYPAVQGTLAKASCVHLWQCGIVLRPPGRYTPSWLVFTGGVISHGMWEEHLQWNVRKTPQRRSPLFTAFVSERMTLPIPYETNLTTCTD